MTTRITHRLRIGLLGLAALLAACADKGRPTARAAGTLQPIAVDAPGQQVQFGSKPRRAILPATVHMRWSWIYSTFPHRQTLLLRATCTFLYARGLQQWSGGTWQTLAKPDAYQIAQSQSGQPLPDWHRVRAELRPDPTRQRWGYPLPCRAAAVAGA
jgi:hypothetical protein